MIVYTETKDEIINQIYSNMKELKNIKELYFTKRQISRENLLEINRKIQDEENEEKINELMQLLNLTKDNLDLLSNQIQEIDKKILFLSNLTNSIEELNNESFKEKIEQYNESYNKFKDRVIKIAIIEKKLVTENIEFYKKMDNNKDLSNNNCIPQNDNNLPNTNGVQKNDNNLSNTNDLQKDNDNLLSTNDGLKDNNILLISEVQNKVILPYKMSEIEEIFMNNQDEYKNLQDVIEKKYTVPLSNYKYANISRYIETFKLMREREKATLFDSFDLAFEMFGKKYVYPAIITACENLDQLDIYLDCLETNELEDFPFFQINYELYPVKVKSKDTILQRKKM